MQIYGAITVDALEYIAFLYLFSQQQIAFVTGLTLFVLSRIA